ncbi:hypothetical protein [Klebsiella variicola]|jgi:hypothetical protein|nr:hypothetical protein NUBL22018_32830 [Klebsiella variicola]
MGALFTLAASVSTAISKQEKGEPWIRHAVLPVLIWLCSENSEWGKQGNL